MSMRTIDRDADSSVFVEESFWQNKTEVNGNFAERWTELMPADKPPPNMEHFLEFMALDLKDKRQTMVIAAQEHETEIGGKPETRAQHEEGQGVLNGLYIEMRDYYTSVYGRESAEAVGFGFQTEQVASHLVRQVGTVLMTLKKLPDEPMPAPKGKEHLAITPSDIISVLETPYLGLAKAVKEKVVETRVGQKSKTTKDGTHREHKKTLGTHAKCGEMIYRMVGLEKEATQIRRARRRKAKSEAAEKTADGEAPQNAESEAEAADPSPTGSEAPDAEGSPDPQPEVS